nr:peptidoglycan-recognition protein LE-like isoform X1 [Leptinotarsa decemlineata]
MEADLHQNDSSCECEICRAKIAENVANLKVDVSTEKCQNWLVKCPTVEDDDASVYSDSQCSELTENTNNSAMDSGLIFESDGIVMSSKVYSDQNVSQTIHENQTVQLMVKENNSKYENISIYKSRKVHIGDVTYLNGPIFVNTFNKEKTTKYDDDLDSCVVVSRTNWLAQPALGEKEFLQEPVKYVIIGHTATEEGFNHAENTLLIRLIQTFHIESRKWKDIAYNFLIGSDGLAYEGRGWGVIGAHTRGFNSKAIGISFIGCFLDHLPPNAALEKARDLIAYGVKRGSIDEDYILLGHCQCCGVESPGKKLFEEIQTWGHWDGSFKVTTPTLSETRISETSKSENIP